MIRGGEVGKIMLLIIDPQKDFVDINEDGHQASLGVPNASKDLDLLVTMLTNNSAKFDEIHVSLDTHTKTHIAHKDFWTPAPDLFSVLSVGGPVDNPIFKAGKTIVTPVKPELSKSAFKYIKALTDKNAENATKPLPCIWPDHCIFDDGTGTPTEGWKIYKPLADVLSKPDLKGKVFYHEKGTNDLVEMYSIFSSEVKYSDVETDESKKVYPLYYCKSAPYPNTEINTPNKYRNYGTDFNNDFFERLMGKNGENKVFVCGEAKSHCVKTSLEDMITHCEGDFQAKNIYAIEDMMSNITAPFDFTPATNEAFKTMQGKGMNVVKYEEIGDMSEYFKIIRGNI